MSDSSGQVAAQGSFLGGAPSGETFGSYSKSLMRTLARGAAAANDLPVAEEFEFYRSFASFVSNMEDRQTAVLERLQNLLQAVQPGNPPDLMVGGGNTEEDVADRYERLVDTVEAIFERVDIIIDRDIRKIVKDTPVVTDNTKQSAKGKWSQDARQRGKGGMQVRNIQKPQIRFGRQPDNTRAPFVPLLTAKPNASVPLDQVMKQPAPAATTQAGPVGFGEDDYEPAQPKNPHPYGPELEAFTPPDAVLVNPKPQLYGSLESTPLEYIDTADGLSELVLKLNRATEIAIDLEAHSYRTFSGFVCLMQISTRDEDFIVDTLALRDQLHVLNGPFTNPNIVKVLHGADWDILWLQRDFGLYVVNMFDTGQAARVLELGKYSLAYLLHHYCGVTADKQYQLADWRIRPLPEEMVKYAREDTHYLLYVYDRLRAELWERAAGAQGMIRAAWDRSTEICKRRFEKPQWTETSYRHVLRKYQRVLPPAQERVFKALYDWRDQVARDEDESTRYVLPNHMLFEMVHRLPSDAGDLFACCNPVPPLVRMRCKDILALIARAAQSTDPLPAADTEATPLPTPTPSVSSAATGPALRTLYGPVAWVATEVQPTVTLEERLQRCPPLAPVTTQSTLASVFTRKAGGRQAAKAQEVLKSIQLPFSLLAKPLPPPEPKAEQPPPPAEEEKAPENKAEESGSEEDDQPMHVFNAAAAKAKQIVAQAGVDVDTIKSKVVVLSAMDGGGKKAKKKRMKEAEEGAKRPHDEEEEAPVAKKVAKKGAEKKEDVKASGKKTKGNKKEEVKGEKKKRKAAGGEEGPKQKKQKVESSAADFVPFSYESAAIDEVVAPALPEVAKTRSGKQGGKGGFNPYTKIEEVQTKKQPRSNLRPASGNRSMTYKYETRKKGGK